MRTLLKGRTECAPGAVGCVAAHPCLHLHADEAVESVADGVVGLGGQRARLGQGADGQDVRPLQPVVRDPQLLELASVVKQPLEQLVRPVAAESAVVDVQPLRASRVTAMSP